MSVLQKRLKVMLRNVPEYFTRARLLYILGKEGTLRLAEKIGIGPIELTKHLAKILAKKRKGDVLRPRL